MKKRVLITIIIIFGVIVLSHFVLNKSHPDIDKETAQCIGQNSVIYIQFGCSHCKDQEEIFGEDYQYLNVVDCFFELEKCGGITHTPTWVIDNKKYEGVQSIEKLKELTGC